MRNSRRSVSPAAAAHADDEWPRGRGGNENLHTRPQPGSAPGPPPASQPPRRRVDPDSRGRHTTDTYFPPLSSPRARDVSPSSRPKRPRSRSPSARSRGASSRPKKRRGRSPFRGPESCLNSFLPPPGQARRSPPRPRKSPSRSLERREHHPRSFERLGRSRSPAGGVWPDPWSRSPFPDPGRRRRDYYGHPFDYRDLSPGLQYRSPGPPPPRGRLSPLPPRGDRAPLPPPDPLPSYRRYSPDLDLDESARGPPPPLPPAPAKTDRDRDRDRQRRRAKKRKERRDSLPVEQSAAGTGANSVEVNMSARGGFRGGFHAQMQGGPRAFSQSSGHGTPHSSLHGSPTPPQSPFGYSHRSWGNQQPFSPPGQFPSPFPQGNFARPTGPQAHFHAYSPPCYPTGPSAPHSQGFHRGGPPSGPRNTFGGPRGGSFGPGRGHRGSFKSTQWSGGSSVRSHDEQSQASGRSTPSRQSEGRQVKDPVAAESQDAQGDDRSIGDPSSREQMPPPSRPPPTGPQSQTPNRFSFSMKNASKPAAAAPRSGIASQFNGASLLLNRELPTKPAAQMAQKPQPYPRSERDRDRDRERDHRIGLPKNTPTEPASARRAHEQRDSEREPRQQRPRDHAPRDAPREPRGAEPTLPIAPAKTRKVRKTMKRLVAKPVLPPELAKSRSVFFRKPGNESVVGSGTYGKVFKASNVYTSKLVALKRIRMEGERDGFPVTAVREIKLLRSLSHRNVIDLQEVMVELNECFMVFEYMSHDLTGLLNHPGYQLDMAVKKNLTKQLFEGLNYLHTRGVLHRDIKAANILISNEGVLKLADFGLARFYAKRHQLDYTNRVITIWYRPPELLLGETQYGPAVDIWSAACVVWEIFNKQALFPGNGSEIDQLEKTYAVLGTPNKAEWPNLIEMPWFTLLRPGYRKPSVFKDQFRDKLPGAAFDLVASMLQYDPAKRPNASHVLEHPYFTKEEPAPRQASELKDIPGDWHEFESKAMRREKERKERAERLQGREPAAASADHVQPVPKKRANEPDDGHGPEPKRTHVEQGSGNNRSASMGGPGAARSQHAATNVSVAPSKA